MDDQSIGAHYHNHNDTEVVKTTVFVDDVNTHHTSTQEFSLDEVMT
jgi:hypothetical protein